MNKLLIAEPPLQVLPTLAVKIGLNQALFLQQLHYWLQRSKNKKEGYHWVYNSLPDWVAQFPFWSESTIKRTLNPLEKAGIIVTGCYNKSNIDKTKWYRINYDHPVFAEDVSSDQETSPSGQSDPTIGSPDSDQVNMTRPSGQSDPVVEVNMTRPIPETTTEITSGEEKPYNPPDGGCKDSLPKLEDYQPGDLRKAVEAVNAQGLKTRYDKCNTLQSLFPVMELLNSFLDIPVKSPSEFLPVWNRIRNVCVASSLSIEDLFIYSAQARLGDITYPMDLKEFIEEIEYEKDNGKWARQELTRVIEGALMQRASTGEFESSEGMLRAAYEAYGAFITEELVDAAWFGAYA